MKPPVLTISGTARERQGFEYFVSQLGQDLSHALNLKFLRQLMLQSSHCNEPIKHAVMAVGLMGQRLRLNNLITYDDEQANECHALAQQQYWKALKSLREQILQERDSHKVMTTITCLLFTVFEFLQGNHNGCLLHMRSGLNILKQQPAPQYGSNPLQDELRYTFSTLDVQSILWLGLDEFQSAPLSPTEDPRYSPSTLHYFTSLGEVADSLNFQITRFYRFRRWGYSSDPSSTSPNTQYKLMRVRELAEELQAWPHAVSNFRKRLGRELDAQELRRLLIMRMNYHATHLMLDAWLHDHARSFHHASESTYREILGLAKTVLGSEDAPARGFLERVVKENYDPRLPSNLFAFYAGVIHPLYLTSIKCTSLDISKEANALLSSSPWREGAWDSVVMARIAVDRIQKQEARGYYFLPNGVEDSSTTPTFVTGKQPLGMHAATFIHERIPTRVRDKTPSPQPTERTSENASAWPSLELRASRACMWDISQVFHMSD